MIRSRKPHRKNHSEHPGGVTRRRCDLERIEEDARKHSLDCLWLAFLSAVFALVLALYGDIYIPLGLCAVSVAWFGLAAFWRSL